MHLSYILMGIPVGLTPCPLKCAYFADHDFYVEFPTQQQGQYSSVNINGDTDIEAFTICLWLKTSDTSSLGLLRYTDLSASNVLIALSLNPNGNLFFSLLSEDR